MTDFDVTSIIGGFDSQLGNVSLAFFDETNYVSAIWTRNSSVENGVQEIYFGVDEGGHPISLIQDTLTVLTKAQAIQALSEGAFLILLGNVSN